MSAANKALVNSALATHDNFQKFVIASLCLHLALLTGFELKNLIFPSETFVVPESIRVDVVALPDKIEAPEPAPAPEPPKAAPKVAEPPAKTPPPKPIAKVEPKKENLKADEKKAMEKLSAMDSIQKMQSELDAQKKKAAEAEKKPAPTFKGNIVSSGNSFSGLSKLRVNAYLDDFKRKVHDHWVLPQWLSDANLKAQVVVVIDDNGSISRSEIHVSSGNSVFDASCLAAVTNSAPFLPPPPELKEALLQIRFPVE